MWMQINENIDTGIVSVTLYDGYGNILEQKENMTEDVAESYVLMLNDNYCFSQNMRVENNIYKNGELFRTFHHFFSDFIASF